MLLEKLNTAEIEWSKEGYPSSRQYQDKYFSLKGIEESQYVFIEGNQLDQRWQQSTSSEFNLLETGFGSGLNFILTFELWKRHIDNGNLANTQLQYFSIENAPLSKKDFKKIAQLWPKYKQSTALLAAQLPQPIPGRHLLQFQYKHHSFHLYLLYADVDRALTELISEECTSFDAFLLDGFSPNKNLKMWSKTVFSKIQLLASKKATLATYTASSDVSKLLKDNNFTVNKIKGFGSKREMITAQLNCNNNKTFKTSKKLTGSKFAVIGAGLSGCITASKLAQHGAEVSLIEASDSICQGASGNQFGLAYPRLSNGYDNSCLLHLSGFQFLTQQLTQLKNVCYDFSGLNLLIGSNISNNRINFETLSKLGLNSEFVEYQQGVNESELQLHFKTCGLINPKSLAQAYLQQPHNSGGSIAYHFDSAVNSIQNVNQKWMIKGVKEISDSQFDGVVICNGFNQERPLQRYQNCSKPVRGQIDQFKITTPLKTRLKPTCSSNYIIPVSNTNNSQFWVGASYQFNCNHTLKQPLETENHKNFLAEYLQIAPSEIQHLCTRVGVRLSSNDRIPIVGKVVDEGLFERWHREYLKYGRSSNEVPLLNGLYVNIAHGSHGLTTIPILSEHLVNSITESPSPLPRTLQKAILPHRFQQRDINKERS